VFSISGHVLRGERWVRDALDNAGRCRRHAAVKQSIRHYIPFNVTLSTLIRFGQEPHCSVPILPLKSMGPQQGREGHVEAIDLTFSSPEPEARPHAQLNRNPPQHQPSRVVKQEMGSSYGSTRNDNQRPGSTRSGNVPQQQPCRINPHHVKQIIDTSSSKALRSVVLQLCKSSPALSGAIARGLAPHSPWAQALIRGQQAQSHAHRQPQAQSQPAIKPEPRSSEQDAYDRMKQRLGSSSGAHSSNVRPPAQTSAPRQTSHHASGNIDGLRVPPSLRKTQTVKSEPQVSPTDSDDSTNIVDFPAKEQGARRQEDRHNAAASSSSRHQSSANVSAGGVAVRERSIHHNALDQKPKLCWQCGELFNSADMNCEFHPGRLASARPGDIGQYTCCNKFEGEPGCRFGQHQSERVGNLTNAKRPSPSPYGDSQWYKKPRVG
jgi:hypothetical protein